MDVQLLLWTPAALLGLVGVIMLLMLAYYSMAPAKAKRKASSPRPAPEPTPAPPPAPAPVAYQPPPAPVAARPAPAAEVGQSMVVLSGFDPVGTRFSLPADSFGIGRYENAEANILVAIEERSVSRSHAYVRADRAARQYFLQDLGSSFGTFVVIDGQPRKLVPGQEERIYNQDVLQFGNVQVRVSLPTEQRSGPVAAHTLLE